MKTQDTEAPTSSPDPGSIPLPPGTPPRPPPLPEEPDVTSDMEISSDEQAASPDKKKNFQEKQTTHKSLPSIDSDTAKQLEYLRNIQKASYEKSQDLLKKAQLNRESGNQHIEEAPLPDSSTDVTTNLKSSEQNKNIHKPPPEYSQDTNFIPENENYMYTESVQENVRDQDEEALLNIASQDVQTSLQCSDSLHKNKPSAVERYLESLLRQTRRVQRSESRSRSRERQLRRRSPSAEREYHHYRSRSREYSPEMTSRRRPATMQ